MKLDLKAWLLHRKRLKINRIILLESGKLPIALRDLLLRAHELCVPSIDSVSQGSALLWLVRRHAVVLVEFLLDPVHSLLLLGVQSILLNLSGL